MKRGSVGPTAHPPSPRSAECGSIRPRASFQNGYAREEAANAQGQFPEGRRRRVQHLLSRGGVERRARDAACCTVSRAPAICSATSSRCSPIAFASWHPTFPGSASPTCRTAANSPTHSTTSRGSSTASPRSSGSIALRSTCSTMARRPVSAWRDGTRSVSPRSSRRTGTPMRRG